MLKNVTALQSANLGAGEYGHSWPARSGGFAIDGQIKKRAITHAPMLIKEEAHCPDLPWFQGAFSADLAARVPSDAVFGIRIKF